MTLWKDLNELLPKTGMNTFETLVLMDGTTFRILSQDTPATLAREGYHGLAEHLRMQGCEREVVALRPDDTVIRLKLTTDGALHNESCPLRWTTMSGKDETCHGCLPGDRGFTPGKSAPHGGVRGGVR